MSIAFRCTRCDKTLRVKEESAGRRVRCSGCGEVVDIPAPDTSTVRSPARGGGRPWLWIGLGALALLLALSLGFFLIRGVVPRDGLWEGVVQGPQGEHKLRLWVKDGKIEGALVMARFTSPGAFTVARVPFTGAPIRRGTFTLTDGGGSKLTGTFTTPSEARGEATLLVTSGQGSHDTLSGEWTAQLNSKQEAGDDKQTPSEESAGKRVLTLKGHTGAVSRVRWSPDGKRLASASADQTVRVWDAQTGTTTFTLKGHTGSVYSVCWSPDGKRLASADAADGGQGPGARFTPREVWVWDAEAGKEVRQLKGHTGIVLGMRWDPDGLRFATAADDRTAGIWDAAAGKEVLHLKGHTGSVQDVCWSPDGKHLAGLTMDFASGERTVWVWDAATGTVDRALKGYTGSSIQGLCWSPDSKRLANAGGTLGKPSEVWVWDVQAGQAALTLKGHTNIIHGVNWSPDGQRLATASDDLTVRTWDADTGKEILQLKGHTGIILDVCWSPDSKHLASASWDRTVRVWDLTD